MINQNLPSDKNTIQEQLLLKAQIEALKEELETVEQETNAFETLLRSKLIDLIIEEQELSVLYRNMQKAKKEKRLEQKKRGKNYKEPQGLKRLPKREQICTDTTELKKEKKRLYREAMLHVHPDKFSMNEDKIDLATEVTSKLIQIYQSGSLEELRLYHNHIFSGNALMQSIDTSNMRLNSALKDLYLEKEKEELERQLIHAKNRHTYRVFKEYENPMSFADELKAYYTDRLFKLRKRTRKARV